MATKKTHGGARPGSGRKPRTEAPAWYSVRVSQALHAALAALEGDKLADYVRKKLNEYAKKRNSC